MRLLNASSRCGDAVARSSRLELEQDAGAVAAGLDPVRHVALKRTVADAPGSMTCSGGATRSHAVAE